MKAGTAQKMVLNMLSTASMIRIGKTYENYMIDVQPTNSKLRDRAIRIVSEISGSDYEKAKNVLTNNNFDIKISILCLKLGISSEEAAKILLKHNGRLRETLNSCLKD